MHLAVSRRDIDPVLHHPHHMSLPLAPVKRNKMAIFLVATRNSSDELDKVLESQFPDNVLRIADNQWFVAVPLSAGKLHGAIDPGEGGKWGDLVVVTAGNYSGWHDLDTWEWIDRKRSESRGG